MVDITPALNELLKDHSVSPISTPSYTLARLSSFLSEAHQINSRLSELLSYLRSIRQPYLSAAPPPRHQRNAKSSPATSNQQQPQHLTDAQRDKIDAEAKSVLRDAHAAISSLRAAEAARVDADAALAQKKSFIGGRAGMLGRWAAGGGASEKSAADRAAESARDALAAHREGVLWFLQRRLELCGQVQSEMMQVRLRREEERSKSILHKSRGMGTVPAWDGAPGAAGASKGSVPLQEQLEGDATRPGDAALDEDQLRIFAKENNDLLKHYESKLDQVRTVEQSLIEISELQSTLAGNLEIQSAHIDQLVSDSLFTEENIGSGNKELKKSSERKSTAKFVFWGSARRSAPLLGALLEMSDSLCGEIARTDEAEEVQKRIDEAG